MATYYKYEKAEDISKSMIDWSGLTKTISDNLMGEKKRRDDLKQKHELDNAKQLQELEKFEQGLDPTLNAKMLEYSQSYKQYLLENHKLMKRGLITVNDSMLIKQNASDSWANMNAATKNFNQNIKAVIDKGGNVNDFKAKFAAELFDFKGKKLFINDQGVASVANVDDKGDIDKNTLVPWTALNNTMMQPQDRFDIDTEVARSVKNAATWKIAVSSTKSIEDVRNNPEFKTWKTNTIKGILNGNNTEISAASDYMDMEPTTDKGLVESNPEKYFLAEVVNGETKFSLTPTQKTNLEDAIGNQLEIALGKKEEKKFVQETAAQTKARLGAADEEDTFRLIQGALQGSESDLQSLSNIYGFKDIKKLPNGDIQIVDSNNKVKTVKLTDSFSEAAGTFASALNLGSKSSEKIRNQLSGIEGGVSNSFMSNIGNVGFTTTIPAPISKETIESIDKAFGYTDKPGSTGGTTMSSMNKQTGSVKGNIIAKVAIAARNLGLNTDLVTYDGTNVFYNNEKLGNNGASIANRLQEIKQGAISTGRLDNVNIKTEEGPQ